MDQILSQEEIDALLKGISEGDVETEKEELVLAEEPEPTVQAFDFLAHTKIKKEKLPALDFIFDRFCKSLRSALSLYIEREVDITIESIQHLQYRDFIKTLPLPTNMNVVVTENLKGFFIVIFDVKLIFSVLETIFGSSSVSVPKVEGREFTKIEFSVIRKLIDVVSSEMEKAWAPVYEIKCKYSRSEINPNYITMVSEEEVVNVAQFVVEMEDMTCWMKLCIPYGILESIKGYLISTPSREDQEMRTKWFEQLRGRVSEVPLEVRAVLGKKKMPLSEFVKLGKDSVIVVDRYVNDMIDVVVHGKPKLKGRIGVFKGNKAVRVEETVH
jgi:flagellar motor switch protein FliM